MKVVAVMPVKSHSARVPRKNFRYLADAPLWTYAARNVLACPLVSHLVIDTDNPDAFQSFFSIGRTEVRERPKNVQGDDVSMNAVLKPFVDATEADVFVQVHATSPFVDPRRFQFALEQMAKDPKINSIMSVTKHLSRFYYANKPVNFKLGELVQTQKLRPLLEDNSAFYIFRKKAFLEQGRRNPEKCLNLVLPSKIEAIDIDDENDWNLAEAVAIWQKSELCLKHGQGRSTTPFPKDPKLSGEATF